MYLSGIIVLVISLALMFIALFNPWFHQDLYGEGFDGKVDAKLWEYKAEAHVLGITSTEKVSYTERDAKEDMPNEIMVFYATLILVIISISLLAFSLFSLINKPKRKIRGCTIAIILMILTPIFFMIAFPIAANTDPTPEGEEVMEKSGFLLWRYSKVYEEELGEVKIFSNPGWAWYLFLVASIIAIIGRKILLKSENFANL